MKRNLTLRQFLFILPLLAIVSVFSLYPILSSFAYTLFDYRTNDQPHAKLFVNSHLNGGLFYEDCDYILYYLQDDITLVGEGDAAEFEAVAAEISTMMQRFAGAQGTTKLSQEDAQELAAFLDDVGMRLEAVYSRYPDVQFYNRDKMPVLLNEMRSCFIDTNFIGLEGYGTLLGDKRFASSLTNTLVFTVVSVTIELVLGLLLALIMNRAIKGVGIVRTTALIPWAIPTAVSALIWSYLYDGGSGVVAQLFYRLGLIAAPEHMLLSAGGAMTAAILADIWKTTPYMALLLLAGLQIIDPGLYESASIDGANRLRTFFRITLPLLKPSILVALLFRTLDAFRVYDLIAVLTGGGPGGATETLSVYAYKVMVSQSNYGYGSVIVVAMFLCVALIAFVFVRCLGAELIHDD
ncbi:MAG: sugar ABC transporter permease [Candidatus Pelethousia sp.]|nr:sugar ABC transporter permease [Candidatus Pelethousia sp.]